MDFQVEWTDLAISDLEQIVSFIAEDNPVAAATLGEDIFHSAEVLHTFPFIGSRYPWSSDDNTRQIFCRKWYRIIYRIWEEAKRVEIVRIWHGARNKPDTLI